MRAKRRKLLNVGRVPFMYGVEKFISLKPSLGGAQTSSWPLLLS